MNDDRMNELILKISTELAILNTQTKQVLDTLSRHESRLTKLEEGKSSMKDVVVGWLVKALICAIAVIGSLTGAGSLLKAVFGL